MNSLTNTSTSTQVNSIDSQGSQIHNILDLKQDNLKRIKELVNGSNYQQLKTAYDYQEYLNLSLAKLMKKNT